MKVKNYKSIVHNFAHSLQSYDYTHSGKVVFDILADAYCLYGLNWIEFDFISKTITPAELDNPDANELFQDYNDWLPELIISQNADLTILEKLTIKIMIDFDNAGVPDRVMDAIEIKVITEANYKLQDKDTQKIKIEEIDVYGKKIMPQTLRQKYWN